MNSEWKTKRLLDIAEFNPRESLPKGEIAKKVAMDKLQPFYRDIPSYELEPYSGGVKFRNGDTIMARITPCLENGKTAKVSILEEGEIGFGSTEYIVFRAKKGTDPDYLFYLVCSPMVREPAIKSMVGSSGRQRVQTDVVQNLELKCPPTYIQEKIGGILRRIDDKIALNNSINENLEEQARAIFFFFISDHQTTTVTVEDIVLTANTGADAIRKAPIVDRDTGVRCVRVGDMSNKRPVHEWGFAQVTPEIFKQYQLHKDDIVVTRTASLGLNRLIGEDLSAVYNNGLIRISVNQDIVYPLIVYRQFQTEDYRNYISRISGETSVRPNMKINYLLKYSFDIPSLSNQAELISILQPIFETQERNISENQTLSSLRDTMLPKLMSGELYVPELDL